VNNRFIRIFKMFNRYLKRKRKYKFFCLQVEPTTRCQLKCRICPRSDQTVQWIEEDMPLALYKKLADYFRCQACASAGVGGALVT